MRGAILLAVCLLLPASAPFAAAAPYDLVILHGRVMDPQTGADRIANVGVRAGKIAAISVDALDGARIIDAKGLVVAPGFIDLHSHAQYAFGYDQQAQDGVTTSLELEEGVYPIAPFYAVRQGKTRINFGASVGLQSIRVKIKTGIDEEGSLDAPFNSWRKILPRTICGEPLIFFRREDGSFGFEAFRRDAEDRGAWFVTGHYSALRHASREAAETAALAAVGWLRIGSSR